MRDDEYIITGRIAKTNTERRLVFGWASIIEESNGEVVQDFEDDVIRIEELEKCAYNYVLMSRIAGTDHEEVGVGILVESVVFSKEKQKAMGIPDGVLPVGWWIGFKVSQEVFDGVKSGKYRAFSIGGNALRERIDSKDA